jgi:F-box interacting protein
MSVVGTCNGLVCLCDHRGAITVANPVTRDALCVPPLPPPCTAGRGSCFGWSRHEAYSFAYLPTTGRYKVVHVPCVVNRASYDGAHVITLGDASWRDMPAGPDAKCDLGYGVISVDGATYWASKGAEKVMSLDLEDERVTSIASLPSVLLDSEDGGRWHLAEVHGRLGIVFSHVSSETEKTEVWVMEGATTGGQEIGWSLWYVMQVSTPRCPPEQWPNARRRGLTWPLFVHGKHVLTWEWSADERGCVLYSHIVVDDDTGKAKRGVVDITETNRGTAITNIDIAGYNDDRRTFGYVETKEPLSIYMPAGRSDRL